MDFTVNSYNIQPPSFQAHLNRNTRKCITRGILTEIRKEPNLEVAMKKFNELSNKYDNIKKLLAEEFGDGTFALYNENGLSPIASKISFWDGKSYKAFDIPEEVQNEIKVVDKSNIFTTKFKIMEFPADKLDWLTEFFSKIRV